MFKAPVQVGAYDPADEHLQRVWGLLAEARIPVAMHCGSGPAPGEHTGPEPIARVLARHPQLRLIVAHMGMPEYEEFLGLAERYDQVRPTRRWRSPTSAKGSCRSRARLCHDNAAELFGLKQ